MISMRLMASVAALSFGAAGLALAQSPTNDTTAAGTDASRQGGQSTGLSGGGAVNPVDSASAVPLSSSGLGDATQAKAADQGVVSNGPVADTPENRAKYGAPESHAGKRSAAKGN